MDRERNNSGRYMKKDEIMQLLLLEDCVQTNIVCPQLTGTLPAGLNKIMGRLNNGTPETNISSSTWGCNQIHVPDKGKWQQEINQ